MYRMHSSAMDRWSLLLQSTSDSAGQEKPILKLENVRSALPILISLTLLKNPLTVYCALAMLFALEEIKWVQWLGSGAHIPNPWSSFLASTPPLVLAPWKTTTTQREAVQATTKGHCALNANPIIQGAQTLNAVRVLLL